MYETIRHRILAALFGLAATAAGAQPVTVVEYYNTPLDAYFITGRANEQQQLDGVADFKRTGMTFQAVAAGANANTNPAVTRICRFYVNMVTPYSSTHFYGREGIDCERLRMQNLAGFTWEDYDFALAQPDSGVCPDSSTTIYRSFRAAANGKTANHRYSSSAASYVASTRAGYVGEQAAFCAVSATDVTPLIASDCGTFYYPDVRVSYQSLTGNGYPDSWVRILANAIIPFNGRQATPVLDRSTSGPSAIIAIEETATTWAELGIRTLSSYGSIEILFNAPTVYPRKMALGQQIQIFRTVVTDPPESYGAGTQTGRVTMIGRESITVPAGTFSACKFSSDITTQYATVGRTDVAQSTIWVAANVGIIRSTTVERITTGTVPVRTESSIEVMAVAVHPL